MIAMVMVLSVSLLQGGHWESGRSAWVRCELRLAEADSEALPSLGPPRAGDKVVWRLEHNAGVLATGSAHWTESSPDDVPGEAKRFVAEAILDIEPVRAVTAATLFITDQREGESVAWAVRTAMLYPPLRVPAGWRSLPDAVPWVLIGEALVPFGALLRDGGVSTVMATSDSDALAFPAARTILLDQTAWSEPTARERVLRDVRSGGTAVLFRSDRTGASVEGWTAHRIGTGRLFVLDRCPSDNDTGDSIDPRIWNALVAALDRGFTTRAQETRNEPELPAYP